jgi:hypothetical protein
MCKRRLTNNRTTYFTKGNKMNQIIITQEQQTDLLRAAFDQVCDKNDWKAPIDVIVPNDMANIYMQAIQFMTGANVIAESMHVNYQPMYRLTSVGYRMGPCGDS